MEAKQNNYQFIRNLSSYQWKFITFRIAIVSAIALIFMWLSDTIVTKDGIEILIVQYIQVTILFNIISEGNVLIDNLSERYFPIPARINTRILLHLGFSFGVGIVSIIYFKEEIEAVNVLYQPITWLMIAFGFIFMFILIVVSISLRITSKWIKVQEEVDDLKQLQLKNDYNALQDQLNPHFLFNNLSVLKSMIKYAPDSAIDFTQNFTDVYRYVLKNTNTKTVLLAEELEFIRSYIGLHKERLGCGLNVELPDNSSFSEKKIPPLSLQLLVENAIKHNIATKDEPLTIKISRNQDTIIIENNLQPKETSYSTSKGLKNLIARYTYLTEREINIIQNGKTFTIELPLL